MQDYSNENLEPQKYILSYERLGDILYLKLANKKTIAIDYSENNEKEVISRMEKQARSAEPVVKLKGPNKALPILTPLWLCTNLYLYLTNFSSLYAVLTILSLISSFFYVGAAIINSLEKKDIKKLNYFLDNKQELNDDIEKTMGADLNLSKKTIRQIENEYDKKRLEPQREIFNINNIDNYSLKDLKKIKKYIYLYNYYQNDDLLKQGKIVSGPVLKKTNKKR